MDTIYCLFGSVGMMLGLVSIATITLQARRLAILSNINRAYNLYGDFEAA